MSCCTSCSLKDTFFFVGCLLPLLSVAACVVPALSFVALANFPQPLLPGGPCVPSPWDKKRPLVLESSLGAELIFKFLTFNFFFFLLILQSCCSEEQQPSPTWRAGSATL